MDLCRGGRLRSFLKCNNMPTLSTIQIITNNNNHMDILTPILSTIDISFKYILLLLNSLTLLFIYIHRRRHPKARVHNILFIIAHPDDESMFFRPTILGLKDQYFVHVLCMTGKGTQREEELVGACRGIGVHAVGWVGHEEDGIRDGVEVQWDLGVVVRSVRDYVLQNNIKAIFTFDNYGISNHPNHKAIHTALSKLQTPQPPSPSPSSPSPSSPSPSPSSPSPSSASPSSPWPKILKIYYLQSTNILRKYTGPLQILYALLRSYSWITISPLNGYQAMAQHGSQFVWYRKLWVLFSRYQYVNTYSRKFVKLFDNDGVGEIKEQNQVKDNGEDKKNI